MMAGKGVTANQVTITAMILSVITGLFILFNPASSLPLLFLPLVLFLRMGLNALDGMLAREHDMKSDSGAILNELGDVISDAFLYLPLALVPLINPYLIIVIVIAGLLTEMAGVIAVQIGASRRVDGPMGKSDRAFVLGSMAFFIAAGWLDSAAWINTILAIVLILSVLTVVNRTYKALAETADAS